MTNGLLAAVAATTGAAVMIVELMAVRLMAPWFGQSQLVWTNVIGVVLAALAAGQWLGGRWAHGRRGPGPATLILVAAGLALALPNLVAWMAPRLLPRGLPLMEAYPFVTLGSLLVSLLAIGLPMLALGAVTPWLVRLSLDATSVPGRVAGRLLGAGTLGSLVGTFGATHLLLQWLGSAGAVRLAGVLLLLIGLVLLPRQRASRGTAWLALLPLLALLLPVQSPPTSGTVLAELETPYQWARVEQDAEGTRWLRLNEGLDSFHSVYRPDGLWTGTYFDAFLYPALVAPAAADGARDVLVVGLAAGTMARQLLAVAPGTRVRGVELDAAIVELGRRWFELPAAVQVEAGVDGRVVLERDDARYGAILVDAYAQQIYLPPHLCTEEFFRAAYQRLLPGGVVALNVGGITLEDPVVDAVAGTFGRVFEGASIARIPGTRNMLVLGFRGQAPGPERVRALLSEAGVEQALRWVLEGDRFSPVPTPRRVLVDGNAPVEALAHDSWQGRRVEADAGGLPPVADVEAQLEQARRLIRQTRWSQARQALERVPEDAAATLQARAQLLLGNIAYEAGDADAAHAHYQRVQELAASDDVARTAAENGRALSQLQEGRELHRAQAGRLRLGLGSLLGGLVLLAGLVARRTAR